MRPANPSGPRSTPTRCSKSIGSPSWQAPYRGHEGIRELLRLTAEVFDQFRYEGDDLIDAGDSVLALGRLFARGIQSGATGAQHGAIVFQIRDGLIVGYRSYFDRKEALAAVGLGEQE